MIYLEYIGISITEFLSWYSYGYLKILSERVVAVPSEDVDSQLKDRVMALFARCPQIFHEEEHGIIIVRIKRGGFDRGGRTQITGAFGRELVLVSIEDIDGIFPLTSRAGRLIRSRLPMPGPELEEPLFEQFWHEYLFKEFSFTHLQAGRKLPLILFPNNEYPPDWNHHLHVDIQYGLRKQFDAEYEIPESAGEIARAFVYRRQTIMPDGSVSRDLGERLNSFRDIANLTQDRLGERTDSIDNLSKVLGEITSSVENYLFADLAANRQILEALEKIRKERPSDFSVSPISIIIFLRWRDKFRNQTNLDMSEFEEDVFSLNRVIAAEKLDDSLFLFGCFMGYSSISGAAYQASTQLRPLLAANVPTQQYAERDMEQSAPSAEAIQNKKGVLDKRKKSAYTAGADMSKKQGKSSEESLKQDGQSVTEPQVGEASTIKSNTKERSSSTKKKKAADTADANTGKKQGKSSEESLKQDGQSVTELQVGEASTPKSNTKERSSSTKKKKAADTAPPDLFITPSDKDSADNE